MEFKEAKQVAQNLNEVLGTEIRTVAVKKEAIVEAIKEAIAEVDDFSEVSDEVVAILEAEGLLIQDAEGEAETEDEGVEYPEEYPAPEDMAKEDFELLKQEYGELKANESRTEDEEKRFAYLKATGGAVNEYLKKVKAEKAEAEGDGAGKEDGTEAYRMVCAEINVVLNFEEPIPVDDLDGDALKQEILDNIEEITADDFTKKRGRKIFSKDATEVLARLGCEAATEALAKANKPKSEPKADGDDSGDDAPRNDDDSLPGQVRRLCNSKSKYAPFDRLLVEGTTVEAATKALAGTDYENVARCEAHIAYRRKTGYVITEDEGVFKMVGFNA